MGHLSVIYAESFPGEKMKNREMLLNELKERKLYEEKIIEVLKTGYNFVDKKKTVAKKSATAGHIYSFLAMKLGEKNSWQFQRKVKNILIRNNIIKPVSSNGILWFVGIAGLEEDQLRADKLNQDHYIDRKAYRARQREYANKRYTK